MLHSRETASGSFCEARSSKGNACFRSRKACKCLAFLRALDGHIRSGPPTFSLSDLGEGPKPLLLVVAWCWFQLEPTLVVFPPVGPLSWIRSPLLFSWTFQERDLPDIQAAVFTSSGSWSMSQVRAWRTYLMIVASLSEPHIHGTVVRKWVTCRACLSSHVLRHRAVCRPCVQSIDF